MNNLRIVFMSINLSSNNERLRELVEGAGLTQLQALLLFNKGLGPAPYSESGWRAFFVDPAKPRFRPFKDAMLKHAEKTFGKLQKAMI